MVKSRCLTSLLCPESSLPGRTTVEAHGNHGREPCDKHSDKHCDKHRDKRRDKRREIRLTAPFPQALATKRLQEMGVVPGC